jgi:hypothetical protein
VPARIRGRRNLWMIAGSIGVPIATFHQMKADRDGCVIVSHSNAIKPTLDEYHKFARALYSTANLNLSTEEYFD